MLSMIITSIIIIISTDLIREIIFVLNFRSQYKLNLYIFVAVVLRIVDLVHLSKHTMQTRS